MSSSSKETEEPTSTNEVVSNGAGGSGESGAAGEEPRPPAKRRMSSTVIEISDTESDDSDICAVTSYQASADEVKRIRGADYSSSSSSSSEYSSDSESPWEDDSLLVESPAPAPGKPPRAQLNPRADRTADPKLNNALQSQELIDRITDHWKERKDCSSKEVTLTCEPFRLCLLHNLLSEPDVINNIVDDMNTLDWSRKKMDLYEFHQTTDLASLTWQRGIKGIYELLRTEVMSWVSKVTGLELTGVSASCSLYGPGDHLLVHDDLLADRRVAFILYLAPWRPRAASYRPAAQDALENGASRERVAAAAAAAAGWAEHMGGALELLARDGRGRPAGVAHRVSRCDVIARVVSRRAIGRGALPLTASPRLQMPPAHVDY
ncbi:prolyl 3-hydroxylase sudestada1 [Hyposmocoma kahamanoa]|uniref:prolyl 3-hydroxylase sudestada1 n=1 Tax=Hyposmocoma kahamanoa TaxID=1477025 RepID=UPI000E6D9617|nr:prolyl 3-hydroxylase sudestada1 [Hyposmocoma kahamanoa]